MEALVYPSLPALYSSLRTYDTVKSFTSKHTYISPVLNIENTHGWVVPGAQFFHFRFTGARGIHISSYVVLVYS